MFTGVPEFAGHLIGKIPCLKLLPKKISSRLRPCRVRLLLCFLWSLLTLHSPALSYQSHAADSLRQLLETSKDTVRLSALTALCWEYMDNDDSMALQFGTEAMLLAREMNHETDTATVNKYLGEVYWNLGDLEKALTCYGRAIETLKKQGKQENLASVLLNAGTLYEETGDYSKATEYYLNSLKLWENNGVKTGEAKALNNLGLINIYQGNYGEGFEYCEKALQLFTETGDKENAVSTSFNIAGTYLERKAYIPALANYQKALGIFQELNHTEGIVACLNNLGVIHKTLGSNESALDCYNRSLELAEKTKDALGVARALNNIGELFALTGRFEEAVRVLKRSISLTKSNHIMNSLKFAYLYMSGACSGMGNYKAALENHRLYTEVKDSLFNEEKSKEIGRLEAKYELEKKTEETVRVSEQKALRTARENARRNHVQYTGIFVFVLLLFALLFMSGRFHLSSSAAEGLIFLTFLLFFELCLVVLDPYIEAFSGGEPAYKLMYNACLAVLIFPLHSFFEKKLMRRLQSGSR